jgi:hypothetical protein
MSNSDYSKLAAKHKHLKLRKERLTCPPKSDMDHLVRDLAVGLTPIYHNCIKPAFPDAWMDYNTNPYNNKPDITFTIPSIKMEMIVNTYADEGNWWVSVSVPRRDGRVTSGLYHDKLTFALDFFLVEEEFLVSGLSYQGEQITIAKAVEMIDQELSLEIERSITLVNKPHPELDNLKFRSFILKNHVQRVSDETRKYWLEHEQADYLNVVDAENKYWFGIADLLDKKITTEQMDVLCKTWNDAHKKWMMSFKLI